VALFSLKQNLCHESIVLYKKGIDSMIDIYGGSNDPKSARLSNFTDRPFMFEGVACAGIEGLLQALKEHDAGKQFSICALVGKAAEEAGNDLNSWKELQTLWWKGVPYVRSSRSYQVLITCVYDAVYEQDSAFKKDLLTIGLEDICHSIGNPDQADTVLTEVEMIHQLNRLRIRALGASSLAAPPLKTVGIPKYSGAKRDGDPVAFLQLHYAEWLTGGFLTQVNLRKRDEKLLNAIKYEMRKDGRGLADIVPPGINLK
jgi:hypothetical protein